MPSAPHYLVLEFGQGQSVYDLDLMDKPKQHPSVAAAKELARAGPPPVTLLACLEVSEFIIIHESEFCYTRNRFSFNLIFLLMG